MLFLIVNKFKVNFQMLKIQSKIVLFSLLFLLSNFYSYAQNLVLNPSFETFSPCPVGPSELINASNWRDPFVNIVGDTCSTSDLYNACSPLGAMGVGVPNSIMGSQPARTGVGYAGIIIYEGISLMPGDCGSLGGSGWREYLEGELTSPMTAGQQYCVSFWVSLADAVKWGSSSFGVHLSNSPIAVHCGTVGSNSDLGSYGVTPQLVYSGPPILNTTAWTKLEWTYTATGGESYITIGNFSGNSSTNFTCSDANAMNPYAYYFIEDVSVEPNACTVVNLEVCKESNGDLTVSGGTGPYTWDNWATTTITPANQTDCTTCGGTWNPGFPPIVPPSCSVSSCSTPGYVNFATGTTVTPPGGATQIQVTDGGGNVLEITNLSTLPNCSASCDATITAAGPFCINAAAVNLTAAETGGTWSGPGITNASNGTFNPATAGVGSHTITYTLGCGDVDTETIVVNALDNAGFSYSSGSYCLTDPNPTPSITGTVGGTFTINNSGVINASTGVINLSGSGLGSYIVTYTTSGTCPDTNTFNITITNTTDATITQAGPFCQNASAVNLTAVSPGGTWSGTGITDGTTGTFNPTTAGVGSHVITYTISGSCGSVDTMTIVVNATDNPAFSYASTSFCLTDANPTPIITGLAGGIFTINNGGVINASTGLINITSSGTGSFTVTYTTNGSCPNAQTFNITINNCTNPLPVANFAASQTNICEGACISFTDMSASSAVGGITSWAWTFTGATPSSSNNQNPINVCYSTAGTYQVILTVTDANGSDDETKVGYITVSSCTPPTAGFVIEDSTICAGECVVFGNTSVGATSWQWTFENGTPLSSTNQNPGSVCFNVAGTQEVKLVVSNSYGVDSISNTITVLEPQQVVLGNDTSIQWGQSVSLTATGVINGVYTWSPDIDLTCTTCPNPISTPEETITYTVITSDSNGCVSSDNITLFVKYENVIFVPNIFSPNGDGANDILFVRGKGVAELKFFIYDRWGEKVFETTRLDVGWDGTFRGKDMNKAVFVYYLEATFIDGSEVTQKGDITLIK
ncbi:MAG: hypothetical protein KFKLKKLM_01088 [Flavobacteriales bacterium]|nr:hypothetical protein [Flavobacteriales bacterium]